MPLGEAQAARAVDGDEVVGVQEAEPLQAAAAQKRAHHERAQVLDARHDDPFQQVVERIPVRQRVREGGLGVEDSADLLEVLNEPPDPQQVLDVAPRARLDQKRQDAHQQQVLDGIGDPLRVARIPNPSRRGQEVRGEVLDRLDQRLGQGDATRGFYFTFLCRLQGRRRFLPLRISTFSQRPLPSCRRRRSISSLSFTHSAIARAYSRQRSVRRRK